MIKLFLAHTLGLILFICSSCTTVNIRCKYKDEYVPCNPYVKERGMKNE